MQLKHLFVAAALALFGTSALASEQVVENDAGEHIAAEAPEAGVQDARAGYVWHCTAYAEGHGHDWGFDYVDVHYNHAYYGAMNRCEHATHHHCHDVHCHRDFIH